MHKTFAFLYLFLILVFIGFGIQIFLERGAGIIDTENIIMGLLFLLGLAVIGITHFHISKTLNSHTSLSIFTTITMILIVLLIPFYISSPEHGGLVTAMIGGIMLISLTITFFISIFTLLKKY
jgi:hypothetical protein